MARFALRKRLAYVKWRVSALDLPSTWERAKAVGVQHGKWAPAVFADMLWWAAFHQTGFQDYVDWDFAILRPAQRRTFMTNALSNHLAERFNDEAQRDLFQDKIAFNRRFADYLHRDWLEVESADVDAIREFVTKHGVVIAKVPVSNSGYGVARYEAADIEDWDAFRAMLVSKGEILLEEFLVQHPELAKVSPHIVNTTRVTTFLQEDGTVDVLSFAQKFSVGRGASDQQAFGGFFTLLDAQGRSQGPGYGSHQRIYARHPDTGESITDFQLPETDAVLALAEQVSRVVPGNRYVAWDIVVTPDGPVLLEGNWIAGVYETKPSATGKREGQKPHFRAVMRF